MGNHPSKSGQVAPSSQSGSSNNVAGSSQQLPVSPSSRSRNRQSRSEFNFLQSITPVRTQAQPDGTQAEPRRETRAEREARRVEKERIAREKERERSMKEEHVDGGFLVTMGIYRGTEDFNKAIVRQLQIDRKLAPFWRSISEDPDDLTDAQLVAVARGQPLPPADAPLPPDLLRPHSPASPSQSSQSLMVPGSQPTPNAAGTSSSTTDVASPLPSPSSLVAPQKASRTKALAGVISQGLKSRNGSSTELTPREVTLPQDPFVNGQPLEVALYRNATECPICFVTYPPYLNYTRCCGNPLCSECFVQIKRPDPHIPEHHGEGSGGGGGGGSGGASGGVESASDQPARETHSMLVSEPAVCPYCTRPEFGVTYEPPPFRRGLVSANSTLQLGSSTAMSSQTSLQSATPPTSPTTPGDTRRRTQSLSANAPNVITTDRIRPDWASKLAQQRNTQARRAAAATALHQAAFIMYSGDRQFSFTRPGRFMRRSTGGSGSGPVPANDSPSPPSGASQGPEPGPRTSSGQPQAMSENDRIQQFEEVMLAEAIRLSIASEEERRRKAEKEAKKEAKKKEKEERKAAKSTPVYGDAQGSSSRSSLSLGFGRRRGNSGTSLRAEATVQGALAAAPTSTEGVNETASTVTVQEGEPGANPESLSPADKGKGVDRGQSSSTQSSQSQPISMSSRGASHLRQTSNISSLSSSPMDSPMGSYTDRLNVGDARASGLSLGRGDDGEVTESMFNFTSMASTLGIDLDHAQEREGETAVSQAGDSEATQVEPVEPLEPVEASVATLRAETSSQSPPEVRVIPEEPSAQTSSDKDKNPVKEMDAEGVVDHRQGEVAST